MVHHQESFISPAIFHCLQDGIEHDLPDPTSIGSCVAWFLDHNMQLASYIMVTITIQMVAIYKFPRSYPMYLSLIIFIVFASQQETVYVVLKHGQ